MIYEIRGKQVMLDSDLAKLYECVNDTKSINLAVRKNVERFSNDIYFQLTSEEYKNLKFQIETSNLNKYGGIRTFFVYKYPVLAKKIIRFSFKFFGRNFRPKNKYIETYVGKYKHIFANIFSYRKIY